MNGHAIDLEYEINSPAEIRQFQHRWERDMFPIAKARNELLLRMRRNLEHVSIARLLKIRREHWEEVSLYLDCYPPEIAERIEARVFDPELVALMRENAELMRRLILRSKENEDADQIRPLES